MPLNFRKDTQNLKWWQASLLVQMRTGHIPLQAHLHRIRKVETLTCQNCHKADKTVHHYLIACMVFAAQRGDMESQLRRAAKSMSTLLTNPKAFLQPFKYIHNTNHFGSSVRDT